MSKKHKKVCTALNYIEQSVILVSAITGCVAFSDSISLVGIPIGIAGSAVELKICTITPGIKKYKLLIKKKGKNRDKIVLLTKTKLNTHSVIQGQFPPCLMEKYPFPP